MDIIAGLVGWLLTGLIADWLANKVMGAGSPGLADDIGIGTLGAFVGGLLASFLPFARGGGTVWSPLVAFLGACLLITLRRGVAKRQAC